MSALSNPHTYVQTRTLWEESAHSSRTLHNEYRRYVPTTEISQRDERKERGIILSLRATFCSHCHLCFAPFSTEEKPHFPAKTDSFVS